MGEDRVMLGSDYPFPLGEERVGKLIRESQISSNAKKKLLSGNAARFLGLRPEESELLGSALKFNRRPVAQWDSTKAASIA